jgi:hypothetical protein
VDVISFNKTNFDFESEVIMKAMFLLVFILLFPFSSYAQEETLLDGDIESGGFGGPVIKVTTLNGENAIMVGGRGGWLINHSFVLGGGGYGVTTNVNALVTDTIKRFLDMGYGGVDLEYIASSDELLHLTMGLLVGGGGIGYRNENEDSFNTQRHMDTFFVLEPAVHAELNITHFFRIAAGVSYRYITGLSNNNVSTDSKLSGPAALLVFKFGEF